ncbi:hypothetical protein BDZ89DRAFT_1079141 [Hymenopellis radicata]|nr:hypothetical protein BDZ89DRAFT_1079141 [Hymenopellis radicata]
MRMDAQPPNEELHRPRMHLPPAAHLLGTELEAAPILANAETVPSKNAPEHPNAQGKETKAQNMGARSTAYLNGNQHAARREVEQLPLHFDPLSGAATHRRPRLHRRGQKNTNKKEKEEEESLRAAYRRRRASDSRQARRSRASARKRAVQQEIDTK